jgi:Ferritin-like domain
MKDTTIFGSIDPELTKRVVSRRGAVRETGKMAGALAIASMPVAFGLMARSAFAQGTALPSEILDVLNFALTLEYLEDDFYQAGLASGVIPSADRPIFETIGAHEAAHVDLLTAAITGGGGTAVAKPTFDFTAGGTFPDPFSDYPTFQALSQGFEDTGVRAYKGQAGALISNNAILTTALQIHSVEARHASAVRRLRGQNGWITGNQADVPALAPVYAGEENTTQGTTNTATFGTVNSASEAFDEPMTMEQVNAIAGLFIVT